MCVLVYGNDDSRPWDRPAMSEWWQWQTSADYSIGIEEEVMLLEPDDDWCLAARAAEVLDSATAGLGQRLDDETQDAVLELATEPHPGSREAAAQAAGLRRGLARQLRDMGMRAAAAGTHPSTTWQDTRIAEGDRHQEVYETMRELARREPTFGLHVHVGVSSAERAIQLYNRLRAHLPLLLALSSNSPFWQGRDTGMASVRTPIFQAFPRVGMPQPFHSYADWVAVVDRLIRAGAFPEPTYLWWDIRPQPRFGTVEIRIMDVQSDSDATAALAALVQSLARWELEEGGDHHPHAEQIEILSENRFIAARDGMEARFVDPVDACAVEARTTLTKLLDAARPHAEELGCADALDAVTDLARENGAARQRQARAGQESVSAVIADLAERF